MAHGNTNSCNNGIQLNQSYGVEFGGQRVMFNESKRFVVGSANGADLVVTSPNVSNRHCEIVCSGDGWMLHNLSPDGTTIVGKEVVRNGYVKLEQTVILKIGGNYLQCIAALYKLQPPMRVLKINELMGKSRCRLGADGGNQTDEPIRGDAPDSIDNSSMQTAAVSSMQEKNQVENDSMIQDILAENKSIIEQLKETQIVLKKTVEEKNNIECKATEMQEQLRVLQEDAASGELLETVVDNELQCSICNELLIDAITINCSHTFCKYCLEQWKRTNTICPLCRNNIHHECKTRVIDNFIDRIIGTLSDDTQNRRRELTDSRQGV